MRIPNIATSELGKTLDQGKDNGELTPYLCSINIYWGGIQLNQVKTARFNQLERNKYQLRVGDLLICEGGDIGRCAVWNSDENMWFQNALHRVRPFFGVSTEYLKLVIQLYKTYGLIDGICKGVTIKHFTQRALYSLLFPLPPYDEQLRIVKKVNNLTNMVH